MSDLPVSSGEGWLWLSASLLLAIAWGNLAWFFHQPRPGHWGKLVDRLTHWRFAPQLHQLLRLLYYVALPFAALVWGGALSERTLGLSVDSSGPWLDWAGDLGHAAALGLGTWGVLALSWLAHRRAVGRVEWPETVDAPAAIHVREAIYHEVHWAFYRSVPALTWGAYWGTWAGLAIVCLEALANPAWRRGMADPRKAPPQLVRAALAVLSSLLFLSTENLWLALVLHGATSWSLAKLARTLPAAPQANPERPAR